jgi:hypothetical protein
VGPRAPDGRRIHGGVRIHAGGALGGWIGAEPYQPLKADGHPRRAFYWSETGTVELPSLGWPSAVALGFDGRGRVVGSSHEACDRARAALWQVR